MDEMYQKREELRIARANEIETAAQNLLRRFDRTTDWRQVDLEPLRKALASKFEDYRA